jgi:hypothetical protein
MYIPCTLHYSFNTKKVKIYLPDDVDAVVIVVFSSFIIGALLERFKLTGESTSMIISGNLHIK